ncbi:hypothetical protein JCGZ_11191 [Jatropha curcas]|uniref:Uncharacterized protein n=1 Tax=Jatropha curcas TaxID=180498 RepID=A0A067KSM2_JATCU|nr:hypothetical protein JCGZ_11191 [Jatropha curcas]
MKTVIRIVGLSERHRNRNRIETGGSRADSAVGGWWCYCDSLEQKQRKRGAETRWQREGGAKNSVALIFGDRKKQEKEVEEGEVGDGPVTGPRKKKERRKREKKNLGF